MDRILTQQAKPVSCLLLEDDIRTSEMIRKILTDRFPQLEVFHAGSLAAADQYISEFAVDMMILDVNLPDGNSLDWLAQRFDPKTHAFRVVFLTAFSEFAIRAFKFNAIDFVLKPLLAEDLCQAVEKALEQLDQQSELLEMQLAFQNLKEVRKELKQIVLRTSDAIHVVRLKDILFASADDNYCQFRLLNEELLLIAKPLKYFDERLEGTGFLRIHQSYLVNTAYVRTFKKKSMLVRLDNGVELPVSHRGKQLISDYFSKISEIPGEF